MVFHRQYNVNERRTTWTLRYQYGLTPQQIASITNISRSSLYRHWNQIQQFGHFDPPTFRRTGRIPLVSRRILQLIENIIDIEPTLYIDEIQSIVFVYGRFHMSKSLIQYYLHKMGYSRKVAWKVQFHCIYIVYNCQFIYIYTFHIHCIYIVYNCQFIYIYTFHIHCIYIVYNCQSIYI